MYRICLQDGCGSGTTAQLRSSNSPDPSSSHLQLPNRTSGLSEAKFCMLLKQNLCCFYLWRAVCWRTSVSKHIALIQDFFCCLLYLALLSSPKREKEHSSCSRDACSKVLGVEVLLASRKCVDTHREHKKWRNNNFWRKLQMVKYRGT